MNNKYGSIKAFCLVTLMLTSWSVLAQFPNATIDKYPPEIGWNAKLAIISKNKIKQIHEYKMEENMKDSSLTEKWMFDKFGNQIEDIFYYAGKEYRIFIYKWKNGLLKGIYELNVNDRKDTLSKTIYVSDFPRLVFYDQQKNEPAITTIFYYNSLDSLLVKEERYTDSREPAKPAFETKIYYSVDSISKISYDKKQLLLRNIQKPLDRSNIISYDLDKENVCGTFFKRRYDDKGNLVSEILDVDGEYSITKYFYDENDLLKVKMIIDEAGKETYIYKYTFW